MASKIPRLGSFGPSFKNPPVFFGFFASFSSSFAALFCFCASFFLPLITSSCTFFLFIKAVLRSVSLVLIDSSSRIKGSFPAPSTFLSCSGLMVTIVVLISAIGTSAPPFGFAVAFFCSAKAANFLGFILFFGAPPFASADPALRRAGNIIR